VVSESKAPGLHTVRYGEFPGKEGNRVYDSGREAGFNISTRGRTDKGVN